MDILTSMGQRRVRVDVEYWKGVLPLFHASFVQNDRDEVHASVLQKRQAGSIGEKPNIDG